MVTVNEHLPEDHRDRVTDFQDVRDEAHVPPGNSAEGPGPSQEELMEANEAAEAAFRAANPDVAAPEGVSDEPEDLIFKPHQGASSWYSDPDAMSSDLTQANAPGYEGEEAEYEGTPEALLATTEDHEAEEASEPYDPANYTVNEVVAYVERNPDELARVLNLEHDSDNPRSSLITKLENMGG